MKTSRGGRTRRAAAFACCLLLPLWLGSCTPLAAPATGGSADAGAAAPQPRPAPPASPPEEVAGPAEAAAGPAEGSGSAAASGPGTGFGSGTAADVPAQAPGSPATDGPPAAAGPAIQELPSAGTPDTPGSAAGPNPTDPKNTAPWAGGQAGAGTAVYYVALDDGGTSGVRFGCNDSLVAVHDADPSIREPLHAAMSRLLSGPGAPLASGLYNALSSSTLQYVSGYLDGTTVVVNLTGSVQPGGVCDVPRIEAQLTQTAVTAVGATRAEIYVNGVRLAEVLSLR
ncbi:GerMN domain-containing protein [Arthrobacter sp. Soil736]|uniref:GerMN domain-containing protein n=1 Tax=Arthrobacter sp. Soil736 TaxID=1736395 RepID=UPI0009EA0BAE|nr:GerMN domain-containing protein [Arthrobacter sp. Soil736]